MPAIDIRHFLLKPPVPTTFHVKAYRTNDLVLYAKTVREARQPLAKISHAFVVPALLHPTRDF